MPRKKSVRPDPVDQLPPETPPPPPIAPVEDPNPGAACPRCGCRHAPVQFTQRAGKRTIRTRLCRNCGNRFREVAIAIAINPE